MKSIRDIFEDFPKAKQSKLKILLVELIIIMLLVQNAEGVYAQLTQIEQLYERKVQLLEAELENAIFFCKTMSIVTVANAIYMIFDDKIAVFLMAIDDKWASFKSKLKK